MLRAVRNPCVLSGDACVAGTHISGSIVISSAGASESFVALLGCAFGSREMGLAVRLPGAGAAFTYSVISCNLGLFSLVPLVVERLLPSLSGLILSWYLDYDVSAPILDG